ncbi:MAG: phage tail sheath C-terminal domain-containing protein, partial [Deltaproteobacteria bacterium]
NYTVAVPFTDYADGTTVADFVQVLRANTSFTPHFLVGTTGAAVPTRFFITPIRHSGAGTTLSAVTDATIYVTQQLFATATAITVPGTSPVEILTFAAASAGTWGNNLAISTVAQANSTFTVNVWEKGSLVESYQGLNRNTPLISIDSIGTTGQNPKYVEYAINGISAKVTVSDVHKLDTQYINYLPAVITATNQLYLTGGTNGLPAAGDVAPYIGVVSYNEKTGAQIFGNPEEIDVNIISVPGVTNPAVLNALITICESRQDCMTILDTPRNDVSNKSLTPEQVVAWHNGSGAYADHQAFNSSYAAMYWPWMQIYDPINKVQIWTPPSGHVAAAYAYSDYSTETWYAPAGLNRGHLSAPIKADYNPTLGERDLLYGNGNAINPIATFLQNGINIWGQRTLQRKPSALDRVNVRRLLLYLEKVIATATRYLLFQPNNSFTWTQFIDLVTPLLSSVQSGQGLTGFQVRCDATTNTPDVIDRNEMHALVFIKPTKTAEMIQLTMVLTAQGSSFSEIVF